MTLSKIAPCVARSVGAAVTALALLGPDTVAAQTSLSGVDVNLVGSATVLAGGELQLTDGLSGYATGAAWMITPWLASSSFAVTFEFLLLNAPGSRMADGIAFVMQNDGPTAIGATGANLGYVPLNGVASVVRTYIFNEVGLNSSGSSLQTDVVPADLGLAQVVLGRQTLSYDATSNVLTMSGTLNVEAMSRSLLNRDR